MDSEATEVGESGEMKASSCPAIIEVFFQSIRRLATRKRTRPRLTPSDVLVNPPEKSTCRFPVIFAPANRGPNTSSPTSDCRKLAPRDLADIFAPGPIAQVGKSE